MAENMLRLESFNADKHSLADYLTYFDSVKNAHEWGEEKAAAMLIPSLGIGTRLMDDISEATKSKYSNLRTALMESGTPHRLARVGDLKFSKLKHGETAQQFRSRVSNIIEQCYPKFAASNKRELLLGNFIYGLPIEMRNAVMLQKPNKIDEAVTAAMMFESMNMSVRETRNIPFERQDRYKLKKPLTCYKCNREGHFANKCQTKSVQKNAVINFNKRKQVKICSPRIFVDVVIVGQKLSLLCDTGASISLLPVSLFKPDNESSQEIIESVSGHPVKCFGTLTCEIKIGCCATIHTFRVANVDQGYFGADLMKSLNAIIDFNSMTMSFNRTKVKLNNEDALSNNNRNVSTMLNNMNLEEEFVSETIDEEFVSETIDEQLLNIAGLNTEVKTEINEKYMPIENLIVENGDLFDGKVGETTWIEHSIDTGDAKPVRGRQAKIPMHWRSKAETKIYELIAQDILVPSHSEWSNPIVLVKKKKSDIPRLCLDFRDLNNKTVTGDAFPIPRMDELIDRLHDKKIFTKLDIKDAYYVVPLNAESRKKTAFTFNGMQYEFTRMPMGLVTASHTFARLVQKVIVPLNNTIGYFDDLLVASSSMEEHYQDLKETLQRLRQSGLKLNSNKCIWAQTKIPFLGFEISKNSVIPDSQKVLNIINFPRPKDKKELQRFVGMTSYYRNHIENLSIIAAPLYQLTRKNKPFVWSMECEDSFKQLKNLLSSPSIRHIPDDSKQFIVSTDACDTGIGGVLHQLNNDGIPVVIEYASKTFDNTQKKWSTIEKEAYAIYWLVKKWRHYLIGKKFVLETDHKPLCWLRSKKDLNNKLGRWCLELQEYSFDIEHVKGKDNVVADTLSRIEIASFDIKDKWQLDVKEDEDIQKEVVKNGHNYFEKEGTLFKKTAFADVLVVPKSERSRIMRELHEVRSAGHLGRRKVLEKAKERFFWPKMTRDIKDYLRRCHTCAMCKDTAVPFAPLKPINISTFQPFQRIAMDIMGPIQPVSMHGNKCIILCQDYFTKWVEIKAVPTTEASVMINFLVDEVFSRYGICSELVTDQGSQFMSKEFQDFLQSTGIRHLKTSVYHPQSDLVERTNRTFNNMIRCFIKDEKMSDWDENLQSLAFAYRTAYHEGIGVSPFESIHGWKAKLPVDIYYAQISAKEEISQSELFKKMISVRKIIREIATSKANKRKKDYAQSKNVKKVRDLKEGEMVYWKKPVNKVGISPKLQKRWIGPFKINRRLSEVNYDIGDSGTNKVTVHVNNLKRCYGSDESQLIQMKKRGRPRKFRD